MEAISAPQPSYTPLSGFTDIVRAELWKFRTVRSTYWTLFAAVLFNVALAALAAIFIPGQLSAHDKQTFDSTRVSLGGIHLSQIAFGVLGVLIITSEYSTGLIRTTLSAVPQRRQVLAAKVIVFTATALIIGIASSFAAYFVFQGLLTDGSLRTSISDPGVLRAVTGGGLFLTVLGLLGLGLGAIIRVSAGSIAAVFGLLFVPPILFELLPGSWKTALNPYVPMEAGGQIFSLQHDPGTLAPWTGFGVFCLYATAALAVAFVLINRRDA